MPADRPAPRATQIGTLTSAQWVEHLGDANAWWRETAQRLLVERHDPAVTAAIRRVATSSQNPLGRVQALWTLEGVGAIDRPTVVAALGDSSPVVRASALRLSERFFEHADGRADLLARVFALTKDPSPDVQLQAVLSFGEAHEGSQDVALAQAVRALPSNRFVLDAFYSGLGGRELPLLERLLSDPGWPAGDADATAILAGLARGILASRQTPAIERLISIAASQLAASPARAAALVDGMVAAATGPGSSRRPLQFSKEPDGLAVLLANSELKAQLEKTTAPPPAPSASDSFLWPGKPGVAPAIAPAPLTPTEQARFEAGRTVFTTICAACHLQSGKGQEGLAPPLLDSDWILGNPQAIVRIVLYGVSGALTVSGRPFMGEMPGLGALTDDQIASVLTYLRREWGHTAAPIDPALVRAIRAETAGRVNPYGWRELNPYR